MFSAQYFLVCCLCFAESTIWINPLSLYDISRGKQIMQRSKHDNPELHSEIEVTGVCTDLRPKRFNEAAVYLIDFREIFPIIQINMTVYSSDQIAGNVKVLIDDAVCAIPSLKNGPNVFTCSEYLKGRLLTIHAYLDITICSVHVYTCTAGRRGPTCSDLCINGTYGIACRPCYCRNDDVCRKSDGFCPSGCLDVNSGKNYNCFYTSASKTHDPHFSSFSEEDVKSVSFFPSRNKQETVLRKITGNYFAEKLGCAVFKSDAHSRSSLIVLSYRPVIALHRVVITYCEFDVSSPFSIHITLDGSSCFGMTGYKPLELGTHTFICQRKGNTGTTLSIRHTSYNLNSNMSSMSIGLREIRLLGCTNGFYGPDCKLPCNCFGSACNTATGYCPSGLCANFAKGRNCAAINVAQNHRVTMIVNIGDPLVGGRPVGELQSQSFNFPPSIYDHTLGKWISWWAIQLDGVYNIQGVTLHINESHIPNFRMFAVFVGTEVYLNNYLQQEKHYWTGLGCTLNRDQQPWSTMDIKCVGQARIITVVTYSHSPFIFAAVQNIEIWVCEDGTFGRHCEEICNCRNKSEVCNMATGECFSGCVEGYWGMNCQSPCVSETDDESCWKEVCHCSEKTRGCGPGIILCDEKQCVPGWMGVACNIPCPPGWYGLDCAEKCGPCDNGNQNVSCNPTNGFCLHGCTNNLTTPTCKIHKDSHVTSDKDAVSSETFATVKIFIFGLVIALVVIALVFLFVRLFLIKRSEPMELLRERRNTEERRLLSGGVNEKIMGVHRDYHETFAQRKVLEQASSPTKQYTSSLRKFFSFGNAALNSGKDMTPKLLFGIKKNDDKQKLINNDRCTPMENNTQQDAEQKVALWILQEDFNTLINRRQQRLLRFKGDILNINESTYSICSAGITKEELDRLYDEVGPLGIP